ncbi:hypothetical protein GCM10020216_092470 [Nonomuraea helvata]
MTGERSAAGIRAGSRRRPPHKARELGMSRCRIAEQGGGPEDVGGGCYGPRPTVSNSRAQGADTGGIGVESCVCEGTHSEQAQGSASSWGSDIQLQAGCKPYKMELGLGVSRGECGIVGYRPMSRDVPITVSS